MNGFQDMGGKALLDFGGAPAIVVGGGFGMGRATSLLLGANNAVVAVVDLEADRARQVVEELQSSGAKAIPVTADVTDRQQVRRMVETVVEKLGTPQVLVNIVGQSSWAYIHEIDDTVWERDILRNLKYVLFTIQETTQAMIKASKKGSIVCVASIDGVDPAPRHAVYGAAKAGLISLARTAAFELGPQGIRVNVVSPGMIKTPRSALRYTPELEKSRISIVPMRRVGLPEDIGRAILYFASPLSDYVTGQNLIVDGGLLLNRQLPMPKE